MEKVTYSVALNQDVAGPAKQAADALNKMDAAARKAQSALQGKFANQWEKIGIAASRAAYKQQQGFAKSWEKIGLSAEKAATRQKNAFANSWARIGMEAEKARRKQDELHRAEQKHHSILAGIKEATGVGKLTTGAFWGAFAAEGVMKIGEGIIEAAHKFVEIITDGFTKAIKAGSQLESLRLGYKLSLGARGGKESLVDIDRFSKQTGFDDDEIARLLLPLRRAGFNQKSARTAFAMAGDLAAGNGRGGDLGFVGGLLDTFTNIKLKGGVTRKQLAGMGVDTVEFYKQLAKKLKVSEQAAEQKAEAGKGTDPQLILNTIGDAIEKQQGGKLGTGTEAFGKTMEGRLRKLKQLPEEYLKNVADSPGWARLSERIGAILEQLSPDSPRGRAIISALTNAFDKLVGYVDELLQPEKIDAFVSGFQDFTKTLTDFVGVARAAADVLITIYDTVKAVGNVGKFISGIGAHEAIADKLSEGVKSESDRIKEGLANGTLKANQHWWGGTTYEKVDGAAPMNGKPGAQPLVAGNKNVSVAPVINVAINGDAGKDPNHTGQKVGEEAGKHVINLFERAAQEGG